MKKLHTYRRAAAAFVALPLLATFFFTGCGQPLSSADQSSPTFERLGYKEQEEKKDFLSFLAAFAHHSNHAGDTPTAPEVTYLTAEEALAIALEHASVTAEDIRLESNELDRDDGKVQYEIEFHVGRTEYDYDIDAKNGTVLRAEKDEKPAPAEPVTPSVPEVPDPTAPTVPEVTYLTPEEALAIALEHAGVTAKNAYAEFDIDDGRAEYDVEFCVDRMEYEYEIDAVTGKILDFEKEYDD